MFFYIGQDITARVSGSRLRWSKCPHCDAIFSYTISRTTTETRHAAFMIGKRAIAEAAQRAVVKKLEHKLETEHDAVPCPACGTVQSEMFPSYREGLYPRIRRLSRALGSVVPFALFMIASLILLLPVISYADKQGYRGLVFFVCIGLSALLAFVPSRTVMLMRTLLARSADPNQDIPVDVRIAIGQHICSATSKGVSADWTLAEWKAFTRTEHL